MDTRKLAIDLIEELRNAARQYYHDLDESPLTDEEFDSKLEFLKSIADMPDVADLFAEDTEGFLLLEGDPSLGVAVTADETIKHTNKMLSLGKAKDETELKAYTTKVVAAGASKFSLQAKLDGFAISARYVNGKLAVVATRGDGEVGENMTFLADSKDLTIVGLPATISSKENVEVRGEIFLTAEQFEKVDDARVAAGQERFKNPRNACVGLMKKAKLGLDSPVEATFSSYAAFINDKPVNLNDIAKLGKFTLVTDITTTQVNGLCKTSGITEKELFAEVKKFGEARLEFTIPTDGVVIKPENEAELLVKMGSTSHHPISQVAYKYPGETAVSVIRGISVTVGKTGKLTPVGHFDPVIVDGTLVENASLHNFNWLYAMNVAVDSVVVIKKANDIIPQVQNVISVSGDHQMIPVPTNCPVCDSPLQSKSSETPPKTIICPNLECVSRKLFILKTAVGKSYFHIDGLAENLLKYLYENGIVDNLDDLYTLTVEQLAELPYGYSKKTGTAIKTGKDRAAHIIEYIERSKTRPLSKMLAGLGIETLGERASRDLSKRFKTLEAIRALTFNELSNIEGFGPIKARSIIDGLAYRSDLIDSLIAHGVQFAPEFTDDLIGSSLSGLAFAISGSVPPGFPSRKEWVDYVESEGGAFHSGPRAGTTYMIGDPDSSSSKTKKAKQLGVQFITPEEFTEKFVK